ncbi:MAG: aldose 1-epimerase, partial [Flavobacteriales bacterium]
MPITISHYGRLASGQEVKRFCLTNNSGLTVSIINYGACVISIETPDKDGTFADILLGYDDLAGYEADDKCMGALVGRYCNRIREASFDLDDQTYPLAKNDGENHLHGGLEGFQKRLWEAEIGVNEAGDDVLVMRLFSEDGDQGYPG